MFPSLQNFKTFTALNYYLLHLDFKLPKCFKMVPMIRFFYLEAKFRIGDHRERDDPPSGLAWPEWLVSTRKCLDFTLTTFYLIRCCVLAVNQHPESLAKLARYDPLACVIEQTHFDPFSMVAMVLLMIYSIISQIILFTSDKTKVVTSS